jgi:AsmA protein
MVVVIVAAVMLIPRERIVALAADQVRAATGRELTLAGELSPSFWPVLGVRTGPVTLSNADWAEAVNMVSANAAEIGVELMPLLSGEIKVTALRLVDPVVALEIGGDGQPNWVFGDATASQGGESGDTSDASSGERPKISLPEAVITNGKISFHDARSGQRIELAEIDLTAGLEGFDEPLNLSGSGLWNGERAEFSAFIDTPAAAMEGGKTVIRASLASNPANFSFDGDLQLAEEAALPLVNGKVSANLPNPAKAMAWATGARAPAGLADLGAVELDADVAATGAALRLETTGSVGYKGRSVGFDLKANGSEGWLDQQAFMVAASGQSDGLFQVSFSGPVSGLASGGGALAAKGTLRLKAGDLRGLAKWAGGTALDAPAGTLESAGLEARLELKGTDRIDLSGLTLQLDQTTMTGDAGVNLGGARPMITARLNSGPLDLSPFMGGESGAKSGGGSGGAAPGQGWSTDPLDLSALRAVDAQVAIRAVAVDLGDIEIGRSNIDARLENGKLEMKIGRVDAYGGGMSGTIMLVAGEEAQVATDLTVTGVQLRPLLNALAGFDSLEGLGAFRIKVNGRGRSMDALMNSLDGQGGLNLNDGAILGLNLAAMVRNLTGGGGAEQKTDFSAVTGTFDITDGVLNNTDFSFLGPLLRVIGTGTVDIGGQAQNFRLEPTAVASLTGQGGALEDTGLGIFPILITGTWSNPSFQPDLTAAIEGFLDDPEKTLDAVTGLIGEADPGQAAGALLGTVTGGGEDSPTGALGQVMGGVLGGDSGGSNEAQDSPAGALGQVLGGILGGSSAGDLGSGSTEAGGNDTSPKTGGALGGLIGALGGGLGGGSDQQGGGSVPQPTFGATQTEPAAGVSEAGSGGLAPIYAPLPVPAPANRKNLAALPGPASATIEQAPDESISVPSQQFTPKPATEQPAPEPQQVKPRTKDKEENPLKKLFDKDGALSPGQILKGLEK